MHTFLVWNELVASEIYAQAAVPGDARHINYVVPGGKPKQVCQGQFSGSHERELPTELWTSPQPDRAAGHSEGKSTSSWLYAQPLEPTPL